MMQVESMEIPDVKRIRPRVHRDDRGYFLETWNASVYAKIGVDLAFVQDNQSSSTFGTLRGLHLQAQRPQGKLVRVLYGAIFDVVVDLRRSSPTFRRWLGVELSSEHFDQLWVPPGFAHGFQVLTPHAEVVYKCTDFYAPGDEYSLRWDDPTLRIAWPSTTPGGPIVSPKDAAGRSINDIPTYP